MSCLLELLPLPAQSTDQWLYGEHCGLDVLVSRSTYKAEIVPSRIEELSKMIHSYRPRCVVFFGTSYRAHWNEVTGTTLPEWPSPPLAIPGSDTVAVTATHPAAVGVTNAYFDTLGAALPALRG